MSSEYSLLVIIYTYVYIYKLLVGRHSWWCLITNHYFIFGHWLPLEIQTGVICKPIDIDGLDFRTYFDLKTNRWYMYIYICLFIYYWNIIIYIYIYIFDLHGPPTLEIWCSGSIRDWARRKCNVQTLHGGFWHNFACLRLHSFAILGITWLPSGGIALRKCCLFIHSDAS